MPRLFGTNGVRGIVGQTMTVELALDLGRALGTWIHRRSPWAHHGDRPGIVVGTDHRTSNHMLASAVSAGILSTGCDVLDVDAAPTPAIQYAVKNHGEAVAGVVVTASHNPPEFNGIKFCRGDGREMEPELEEEIEAVYFDRAFEPASWDEQGRIVPQDGVIEAYHEGIKAQVDVEAIRARGFTVALDTANGAGCTSLPYLLRDLGCRVIALNAQPDGTFPGHPSEPTPDNAAGLMDLVTRTGADLGIIVDGDADRTVFVDESGIYVWGDRSLALMAAHIVRQEGGGLVCTPVSSSSCVEEMVTAAGGEVAYTIVGSPKVARAMVDRQAVFGGEENGGLIFPKMQYTRDAAMTAAAMLDIVTSTGKPVSALVAEVPPKSVVKLKTEVPDDEKQPLLTTIRERIEAGDAPEGVMVREVDARDGVKVYFEGGWSLVRPSGTEAIMRVYAEADDDASAARYADAFMDFLQMSRKQVGRQRA